MANEIFIVNGVINTQKITQLVSNLLAQEAGNHASLVKAINNLMRDSENITQCIYNIAKKLFVTLFPQWSKAENKLETLKGAVIALLESIRTDYPQANHYQRDILQALQERYFKIIYTIPKQGWHPAAMYYSKENLCRVRNLESYQWRAQIDIYNSYVFELKSMQPYELGKAKLYDEFNAFYGKLYSPSEQDKLRHCEILCSREIEEIRALLENQRASLDSATKEKLIARGKDLYDNMLRVLSHDNKQVLLERRSDFIKSFQGSNIPAFELENPTPQYAPKNSSKQTWFNWLAGGSKASSDISSSTGPVHKK